MPWQRPSAPHPLPLARFAAAGAVLAQKWRSNLGDCSTSRRSFGWEFRPITTWKWRDFKVRNESTSACVLSPPCSRSLLDLCKDDIVLVRVRGRDYVHLMKPVNDD